MMLPGDRQGFFPICCFKELVALRSQPSSQNFAIGHLVVNDEDEWRIVHARNRESGILIPRRFQFEVA